MAINIDIFGFLIKEGKRKQYSGSVLTLGRMDVLFTDAEFKAKASALEFDLVPNRENVLSHKPEYAARGYISDIHLFKSMGFMRVDSMDISDYENASIILDLCSEKTPEYLVKQYDLILDSGTSEHVFHLPNLFRNIFSMLRQGGRVMHFSPSSNYIEHGYYMFSPVMFWDFYTTNRFDVNWIYLFHDSKPSSEKPYLKYVHGLIVPPFGSDDGRAFFTFCSAEKTRQSTGDILPHQYDKDNIDIRAIISHDLKHKCGLCYDAIKQYFLRRARGGELRRAAFYGIGDFAELAMLVAGECGIEIAGLFDSSSGKWGTSRGGYEIRPPNEINDCDFDAMFITAVISEYVLAIRSAIQPVLKDRLERVVVLREEILKYE